MGLKSFLGRLGGREPKESGEVDWSLSDTWGAEAHVRFPYGAHLNDCSRQPSVPARAIAEQGCNGGEDPIAGLHRLEHH